MSGIVIYNDIYICMNRINLREFFDPSNIKTISEAEMTDMQKKMDMSYKLADYVQRKWKNLQKIKNKQEFVQEFLNTSKRLLRAKRLADNDILLVSNIDKLLNAWKLVLITPHAKRIGLRMSDLRQVQ